MPTGRPSGPTPCCATCSKTMPVSRAARDAAATTGLPKADLYARLLELKGEGGDGS